MKYLFAILVLVASPTLADSWLPMKPEVREQKFEFGDVTVVRGVDGRDDQQFPQHYIKILRDKELVAFYPGLSFGDLKTSRDSRVFVGISNGGLPDTAVIVFDSNGKIYHLLRHFRGSLEYCSTSVTLEREWYNEDDLKIEFKYTKDGYVDKILVNSCKNEMLDIEELVNKK